MHMQKIPMIVSSSWQPSRPFPAVVHDSPLASLLEFIFQLQAGLDVHAQQLLYQQLRRIRNRHAYDTFTALARLAPSMIPHHAALLADIARMRITAQHQPL